MHSLIFEMTTRAAAMPRAGDPSLRSESVGERQKRELRVIAGAPLADGRDRRAAPATSARIAVVHLHEMPDGDLREREAGLAVG